MRRTIYGCDLPRNHHSALLWILCAQKARFISEILDFSK